jgi:hypothetical protein
MIALQKAIGASKTMMCASDRMNGKPWGGCWDDVEVGEPAARSTTDMAVYHALYRGRMVEFAINAGADIDQMPRVVDMPEIANTIRWPGWWAGAGFVPERDCVVCRCAFALRGGCVVVEHLHSPTAGDLFTSRLRGVCHVCNSSWLARIDDLARRYGLETAVRKRLLATKVAAKIGQKWQHFA